MSPSTEKPPAMRCTNCDLPMNRHAEKPMKAGAYGEPGMSGSHGEMVVSIHCCPGCGKVGTQVESRE